MTIISTITGLIIAALLSVPSTMQQEAPQVGESREPVENLTATYYYHGLTDNEQDLENPELWKKEVPVTDCDDDGTRPCSIPGPVNENDFPAFLNPLSASEIMGLSAQRRP